MTLLSDKSLRAALRAPIERRLVITPLLDPDQVGTASIDLRLGTQFLLLRRAESAAIDAGVDDASRGQVVDDLYERIEVPIGRFLLLHPGDLLLGATLEYLRLPRHLGAYVIARSTWGRLGLIVATAIMVQPGFSGCLTLELVNEGQSPLHLYPGVSIAQLAVHRMTTPADSPYSGRYLGAIGPEAPSIEGDSKLIRDVLAPLRTINQLEPPSE